MAGRMSGLRIRLFVTNNLPAILSSRYKGSECVSVCLLHIHEYRSGIQKALYIRFYLMAPHVSERKRVLSRPLVKAVYNVPSVSLPYGWP